MIIVATWRALAALPALLLTLLILAGYAGATVKTGPVGSWVHARGPSVPPADVDLDFTTSAAGLTVTRAGTAYVDNVAGTWASVAANTARQSDKGLLVEEARTNGIRNNSMQGASAGTPGTLPTNWVQNIGTGITRTIVGTGTSLGIDYIDLRFQGTLTGTQVVAIFEEGSMTIAATTGQVWTHSAFLAVVGGSTANITRFGCGWNENTAAGVFVAGHSLHSISVGSVTATLQRFQYTDTNIGGGTIAFVMPYIQISANNGAVVDVTLRIGWPQMEQGAWATSPIRTTSAAVTRAADMVTLASPPVFGAALSAAVAGTPQAPTAYAGNQIGVQIDDGTVANRHIVYRAGTSGIAISLVQVGGVTQGNVQPGVWGQNTYGSFAAGSAANNFGGALNGGAGATDLAGTVPAVVNTVRIGNSGSTTEQWNGYITRVRLWPTTRLSDAQLQQASQ